MSSLRILLIDDHPAMGAAVAAHLNKYCTVVAREEHGDGVMSATAELRPDVVILDISLPGRNGLELLLELRPLYPSLGIVMLTNTDNDSLREEAARRGADGYVLKSRVTKELWQAIQNAVSARRAPTPR